jgi:predicted DsbA family dithiol-disulfide isomerase
MDADRSSRVSLRAMTTTPQLEIFVDFVCPWCYLAYGAVRQLQTQRELQTQHPVSVTWAPFPLHPATPPEGLLLSELLRGMDLDAAHKRINRMLDELGLEHGERDRTYNTRLAQELALWARTQAGGDALIPLLYRAYFVHNRNLAEEKVLLDIVREAGLDVAAAQGVLKDRSFSAALDAEWERARAYQISGVPAFIAGGYQMTGFQPAAEIQRFLDYVATRSH